MKHKMLLVLSVLSSAPVLSACSDETRAPTGGGAGTTQTGGSGGTAGTGGVGEGGEALVCNAPYITKGPWVLGVDEANAKVRWEACDMTATGGITFSEEVGGGDQTANSTVTTITLAETHKAVLNGNAAPDYAGTYYIHEAAPTGLKPGTCYVYSLNADSSKKGRFCTQRPAGESFSFMAIGDTNPGLGHTTGVLENALPKAPEFTLHGGDIQYYDSGLETWASWFPIMQPMLSAGAFFPAIGNHESEKEEELAEYALRFFGDAGFDGGETYYRFQTGGVHFFSLNTEDSIGQGSPQGTWLESRLAQVSALPDYRFSIVFFHKPILTCGDTGDNPAARAYLEPIFLANKVVLVLQAHMHGYERFDLGDITYLTTAGGGGLMGNVDENTERDYCNMRVASAPAYHSMIFNIDAGNLTGTAIDEDGAVIDTFTTPVP
ncbi:MAG: metallophosphoesterase [Polyangiaceae bacterium]|nr:metallophosphoesterase [Polyangiaceae bacterium]